MFFMLLVFYIMFSIVRVYKRYLDDQAKYNASAHKEPEMMFSKETSIRVTGVKDDRREQVKGMDTSGLEATPEIIIAHNNSKSSLLKLQDNSETLWSQDVINNMIFWYEKSESNRYNYHSCKYKQHQAGAINSKLYIDDASNNNILSVIFIITIIIGISLLITSAW